MSGRIRVLTPTILTIIMDSLLLFLFGVGDSAQELILANEHALYNYAVSSLLCAGVLDFLVSYSLECSSALLVLSSK